MSKEIDGVPVVKDDAFPAKYLKKIKDIEGFVDGMASADTEDLKKKILESEGNLYDIEESKKDDLELEAAKQKVKEFAAPYRENKALETAKLQYYVWLLVQRGVNL